MEGPHADAKYQPILKICTFLNDLYIVKEMLIFKIDLYFSPAWGPFLQEQMFRYKEEVERLREEDAESIIQRLQMEDQMDHRKQIMKVFFSSAIIHFIHLEM